MTKFKLNLARAIIKILNPLVRILLRHEISHNEFCEIAKRSYVDMANEHFSIPNRKKTYARVAVLTGLNLKEVKRISTSSESEMLTTKGPVNRAKQVISGWMRDPDFIDEKGHPKILSLKDDSFNFEELVSRYSGDITSRAVLDELLRVGAVEKLEDNAIKLVKEGLIPNKSEEAMINIIAQHNSDLMDTGVFNLTHESDEARFQRQVTYTGVPESVMEEFRLYSSEKSLTLLKDFDKWLAENSNKKTNNDNESTGRVGVGVYYFKNNKEG